MKRTISFIITLLACIMRSAAQAPEIRYPANNAFTVGVLINDLYPNSTGGAVKTYAASDLNETYTQKVREDLLKPTVVLKRETVD